MVRKIPKYILQLEKDVEMLYQINPERFNVPLIYATLDDIKLLKVFRAKILDYKKKEVRASRHGWALNEVDYMLRELMIRYNVKR